jgi:hypothetical protein
VKKIVKQQNLLQRKRELMQQDFFEQARIKMIDQLKTTCVSDTKSELKFGDLFTQEDSDIAEIQTQAYLDELEEHV